LRIVSKIILLILIGGFAFAESDESQIKKSIRTLYPEGRIAFRSEIDWTTNVENAWSLKEVSLGNENAKGVLDFTAKFETEDKKEKYASGKVSISVYKKTWIPNKRIRPGEQLNRADFKLTETDIASGLYREYRGIFLPLEIEFEKLQARGTLIEGTPALMTAIEKIPDIRRGENIRVIITTGTLQVTTHGVAQEPGLIGGQIRILTNTGKKELVGSLKSDKSVEVAL
jgi:flagella basal body P-ring formation protein FlgA